MLPSNVNSPISRWLEPREQRKSDLLSHLGLYLIEFGLTIAGGSLHYHLIVGLILNVSRGRRVEMDSEDAGIGRVIQPP